MSAQQRCECQAPCLLPSGGDVALIHSHPPLAQSQETGLRANSLDVGTGEVILCSDKLLQIDIFRKCHS